VIPEPGPARTPTIAAYEIRGDAAFVDEHVLPRIAERQPILPAATRRGDVRPALFVSVYGFF
jgi:hypothetical protein